jgi:hypothetical protein
MRTHLRLHRDQPDNEADVPVTFRFPHAMAAARERLVAGVVAVQPTPGAPVSPRHPERRGVLAHADRRENGATSTDRMLQDVERTIDEMQHKLDGLKDDVAESFKFPSAMWDDDDDGGRPRAA